ncbi:MAG: NAD(P)/FAD-dependent oxidoreductase [Oscillospiraceae bacterium]|nr:NAD(P)/FAD-dependent oxidoreductase [Oscillospiraceae bacterium]
MRAAVIGAGASGMTAALTAVRLGHEVTLYERQARVGRKLMATGNGRCNLTNTGAGPSNYHGEAPDFVRPALEAFPSEAALDFFRGLGLLAREEWGGRVYPLSNSANSVVDVLRQALDAAGVELIAGDRVRELRRAGSGYSVTTESGDKRSFDAVVVACGGLAGEKLGGGRDGYELLKALGHTRTALRPALVQITTEPMYPRSLKGIKADCALRVLSRGGLLASSCGELLFTETGVSGPAAFDVSRAVSEAGDAKMELEIDFLRDYTAAEVLAHLQNRVKTAPELPASELLTGSVHNRLGRMLIKYADVEAAAPLSALSERELRTVAAACKRFELPVRGTEGFANAQVTAGGIRTSEFDPRTLESRLCPRLFACGEVLDIDGDCGGYNLQWAWSSGVLAGHLGK